MFTVLESRDDCVGAAEALATACVALMFTVLASKDDCVGVVAEASATACVLLMFTVLASRDDCVGVVAAVESKGNVLEDSVVLLRVVDMGVAMADGDVKSTP